MNVSWGTRMCHWKKKAGLGLISFGLYTSN
jgi:hypothetical protein